ncbi:MAG TPA: hypothetical protein VNF26_00615 [Candidatus Baltobacterales bacterium]|nr:hypothetical protein [Candidatus Baltobacterales bacterium]
MSLGLNLSSCDAKLARARLHLDALKRETDRVLNERNPYTIHIGPIHVKSGWCSVLLTPRDFTEYGLGVIVGDLIHNLRSALDYIVTGLVVASGATLTNRHEFPIFTDPGDYAKKVGSATVARRGGPLDGVTHGLAEIERLQPYHRQPQADSGPLFCVQRFSNADKHREISAYMPMLGNVKWRLLTVGRIIEQWHPTSFPPWEPDREFVLGRVRFAEPYPTTNIRTEIEMRLDIMFGVPAFGPYSLGYGVTHEIFVETCDHVGMVMDLFKAL